METFNHICESILLGSVSLIALMAVMYLLLTLIDYFKFIKKLHKKD
jgi:hypothetical protein